MRRKPGQHLSQEGIELARSVVDTLGSYHRIVTSTVPQSNSKRRLHWAMQWMKRLKL